MKYIYLKIAVIFLFFTIYFIERAKAQGSLLKVFLDCNDCNLNYFKTHFEEVDYVRDRKVADIHILINKAFLGSGTKHWELQFIDMADTDKTPITLITDTYQNQTENEVDQHLLKYIKAGLIPFLLNSDPEIDVKLHSKQLELSNLSEENTSPEDPWNFWIFEIGGNIDFKKETNQSAYELEGEIDLERTTEAWRYRGELEYLYQLNEINNNGNILNSSLEKSGISGSIVKTMGEHWAAGIFGRVYSSTFSNIKQGNSLQVALEFNVFPYHKVASKEFTISYFIGPQVFEYLEPTIYEQLSETRMSHNIAVNLNMRKTWGAAQVKLRGVQFLHDLSKNRLEFSSKLSLRIVKGLFFNVEADFDLIRDQLSLPKGDANIEEILLQRRAIATDFETGIAIGLSYTFGSIFNSIVNTRL
ncbi:MAG: hypothetical protein AAGI07_03875 [Bacteroidota bacterium]